MRPVSEAEQRIIVRMSANFRPKDIATYTGVSRRKIENIISHFEQTGDIKTHENKRPSLGRGLHSDDVQVFRSNIYSLYY